MIVCVKGLTRRCKDSYQFNIPSNLLFSEELEKAELAIICLCQKKRYSEELAERWSSELYRFNPVLHSDIIKFGGSLENEMMPEEVKHPVIVAKDLHISDLILWQILHDIGYWGRNYVANLWQRYWIPGSSTIRRLLSKCLHGITVHQQICRKRESHLTNRYSHVGVDCFAWSKTRCVVKRYEVMFTCLTVRVIHLEVAASSNSNKHSYNRGSTKLDNRRLERHCPVTFTFRRAGQNMT